MFGKHIMVFVLVLIALVLFIAGKATYFAIVDHLNERTEYRAREFCIYNKLTKGTTCTFYGDIGGACPEFVRVTEASLAFGILSIIFIGYCAFYAFFRMFFPEMDQGKLRLIHIVFLGVVAVFALITWAMDFALYDNEYCSVRVRNILSSKAGAMAPLLLIGWLFVLGALAAELFMRGPEMDPIPPTMESRPAPMPGEGARA